MQNTDTTAKANTSSALAEPQTGTTQLLKITISHEPGTHHAESPKHSILRRLLSLCGKIMPFSRRRSRYPQASVTTSAPLQQKSVTLQEKHVENIPTFSAPPPHIPNERQSFATDANYLRMMAEQQFREMDVSQASKN